MKEFLRSWWPALVWAGVIFTLSTDSFSSAHTSTMISRLISWAIPSLRGDELDIVNYIARKSAHFTEYFVFYVCLFRAFRGDRKGWRWTWAAAALAIAAGYACFDEIHQAFVASRGASPWDSLLDSFGAFVSAVIVRLWYFKHPPASSAPASSPDLAI